MRRLLFLLIGLLALGTLVPSAPAIAAQMPHHGHAMPPGHCDEGQGAVHLCLGCAVDLSQSAAVSVVSEATALPPAVPMVSALGDRHPGLDPPPPRAI